MIRTRYLNLIFIIFFVIFILIYSTIFVLSNEINISENWKKNVTWDDETVAGENWVKNEKFGGLEDVFHMYHKGTKSAISLEQIVPVNDITKMEFSCQLQCKTSDENTGISGISCTYLDNNKKVLGTSIIYAGLKYFTNSPTYHITVYNDARGNLIEWGRYTIDFNDEFTTYLYGLNSQEVKFLKITIFCKDCMNYGRSELYAGDFKLYYK